MLQRIQQWLNHLLKLDLFGASEEEVSLALKRAQMQSLPFICGTIAVFIFIYALLQGVYLREPGATAMVITAVVSTILLVALRIGIRRHLFPVRWANRLFVIAAVIALVNMFLRLYLTGDPKQSANLVLFLMAIGVLVPSAAWFLFLTFICLAGWVVAALVLPASADWLYYGVVLSAAAGGGLMSHVVLVRSYHRSEVLRIAEQRQRDELQRQAFQLETSHTVGQQMHTALDIDSLLKQIVNLIRSQHPTYYVGIYLPTQQNFYTTARASGSGDHYLKVGRDGLIGRVLRSGQPLRIDDLESESPLSTGEIVPEAKSALLIPMRLGEQLLGVLDLQSQQSAAFDTADEAIFQFVAEQIALAIRYGQLYEQTRFSNVELEEKVRERTVELERAYRQLEQLDKAKGDFISIASHELRTPLTIISFNNQLMMNDPNFTVDARQMKRLGGIKEGVERISEIVERMLDVAKIDTGTLELQLQTVNLGSVLEQLTQQLGEAVRERQLALHVGENIRLLPPIQGDAKQLDKVFRQLLINAIKYTPNGGEIQIDGRAIDMMHNGRPTTVGVEICVTDSGIGIEPDSLEAIFQKFYQTGEVMLHSSGRTKFKGGGSGLGLAIAKGIVDAHYGRIWAESRGYDEEALFGSRFYVALPVQQPANGHTD